MHESYIRQNYDLYTSISYLLGSHFENGGHFEFENARNRFSGSKYPGIRVLVDPLCEFPRDLWYFMYFDIILAAILFYANYLKLPKADSEPTKTFFKLDMWANKIH